MFKKIALISVLLALVVVVLGAYVRLSHAGLGCPDWPGCYGHLVGVPESTAEIDIANQAYPERAVEAGKAWKEVIHRYFAGALGLLILLLAILAIKNRKHPGQPVWLPIVLVGLVIFQALLGMWTVTLLLKPVIVMLHLLGGLTIVALLWWLVLKSSNQQPSTDSKKLTPVLVLGLVLVVGQIVLGGWTSTNYAALACPDFPTCQGEWWPETDFKEGFVFWRGLGQNYEFGVLDNPARTAIHLSHRLFAIVVAVFWLFVLLRIMKRDNSSPNMRQLATITLLLLLAQIALGVSNIVMKLPISVAVMHNGGAALLLLSAVTLIYYSRLE
ncbi:MAG: COX15/CtaA family protein [Gammaproteobacteria bacterium]|nr:COX15/CtaA family protein [Gammaproteobacteria bacterium]